jgi:hypothetical protein
MRKEINRKSMVSMEDNTKTELEERGWEGVDWIHLVQDTDQWHTLLNKAINLRGSRKCWEFEVAE